MHCDCLYIISGYELLIFQINYCIKCVADQRKFAAGNICKDDSHSIFMVPNRHYRTRIHDLFWAGPQCRMVQSQDSLSLIWFSS